MLKESLLSTHVIGEAGAIGKTLVLILIDLGVESACHHFFHDRLVFALVRYVARHLKAYVLRPKQMLFGVLRLGYLGECRLRELFFLLFEEFEIIVS